jgi:Phage P22-like portal protein
MAEDTPPGHDDDVSRQSSDPEALLRVARTRFRLAESALATWREAAREDQAFAAGEQWPDSIEAQRTADGRPCLTINQLPQFIRQVVNEERQNRPQITVQPVDEAADVATAEVLEGLLRQIQHASNADIAYDTALDSVAKVGLGWIRVTTAYVDPLSFDQEPRIERVLNPFTIYLDPTSTDPTAADADWAFCVQVLSKDQYTSQYGALPPDAASWETAGDAWITPDTVRVAEYYWREWQSMRLALLPDGVVRPLQDVPPSLTPLQVRTTRIPRVYWAKIIGHQVLEQTRWLGTSIPLVKVTGEEHLTEEGDLNYTGVVRHAKDSQYAYNLWASAEAETIALAPKVPWVLGEGQQEGYESLWATANTRNHAYLLYKPTSIGGVALPPPTRQAVEPPVQAISQARLLASQDLQSTTGTYAPALGQQGPPGEAAATVLQQRQQSQIGNLHYLDNLRRSVRRVGHILLEVIPYLYDAPRAIRILGADDQGQQVLLNAAHVDPQSGKPMLYDLSVGRYDALVQAGPGYATRRQENVAVLMGLTTAVPQVMQYTIDLLVKNLDMPQSKALAERLHKMLPPELQEGKDGQPSQAQQLAQMQQAMQQLAAQLDTLDAYARDTTQELDKAVQENKILKVRLEDKEAENVLQSQENDLKLQELQHEYDIALRKVALEEQKLALTAAQSRNGEED